MYRIMIVDDEPLVLELLHLILDDCKLDVHIVKDCSFGMEALKSLPQCYPDIIITDINMPDMDGIELIRRVNLQSAYTKAFIVLTGHDSFAYAQQAMKLRVTGYLLKPIFEQELCAMIKKCIAQLEESRRKECLLNLPQQEIYTIQISSTHQFYEVELLPDKEISYILISTNEILTAVENLSHSQAVTEVEAFCNKCCENFTSPPVVRSCIISLMCGVAAHEEMGDCFTLLYWLDKTNTCNSLLELKILLEKWIEVVCVALQKKRALRGNRVAYEVKEFVREHYCENISLTELAKRFHTNSVYLGQQFAKLYFEHFHDYVTRLRMEKAKELLATDMKIGRIAEKVGYKNYAVFKQNFVKEANTTPSNWRQLLEEKENQSSEE